MISIVNDPFHLSIIPGEDSPWISMDSMENFPCGVLKRASMDDFQFFHNRLENNLPRYCPWSISMNSMECVHGLWIWSMLSMDSIHGQDALFLSTESMENCPCGVLKHFSMESFHVFHCRPAFHLWIMSMDSVHGFHGIIPCYPWTKSMISF